MLSSEASCAPATILVDRGANREVALVQPPPGSQPDELARPPPGPPPEPAGGRDAERVKGRMTLALQKSLRIDEPTARFYLEEAEGEHVLSKTVAYLKKEV